MGCDSVVTLHLTVNNSSIGDTTAVACNSFEWYDSTYTQSGDYTQTLTNAVGCDSVVTLHLTVNNSSIGDTTAVACDSFDWYGVSYTQSGEYTHILTNAVGCDSLVTLYLTISESVSIEVYLTIQESDLPYTYGDTTFEPGAVQSGDYTFYFSTVDGCDSIILLHLTVETGIDDHVLNANMNVYPNPATDKVNVQLTMSHEPMTGSEIQVFDIYGKWLNTVRVTGEITELDLSPYVDGIYVLKAMKGNSLIGIRKIVKQ